VQGDEYARRAAPDDHRQLPGRPHAAIITLANQ
jgi:hypothetical protein